MIGCIIYHVLKDLDNTVIPLALVCPDGTCTIQDRGRIDLEPIKNFIGWPIKIFSNDMFVNEYRLTAYTTDENGDGVIYYE